MDEQFELLPVFQSKETICDLQLSRVVMEDTELPWVLLIPRRPCVFQMNHLSEPDQILLMKEISFVSNIMEEIFECDRLNIAAIGNKAQQLHIHVICRTKSDTWWPETVWGQSMPKLSPATKITRANKLKQLINKKLHD